MSNTIKYSEGSESLALNKGNWWIGTGDSNKGPTVESGYWNAINPPSGGYTVYLNKETNGPSIHSITSDENLISFTNKISGNNYTTVAECLVYYQTQDDKLCVNREYENIVTDGLVLNLDAGHASSYPTSGTTWYDLSGNGNNGSLVNGEYLNGVFKSVFDPDYLRGADKLQINISNSISLYNTFSVTSGGWVIEEWVKITDVTYPEAAAGSVVSNSAYSTNGVGFDWNHSEDNLEFQMGASNNVGEPVGYDVRGFIAIDNTYKTLDQWLFRSIFWDRTNNNMGVYYNGQLQGSISLSSLSGKTLYDGGGIILGALYGWTHDGERAITRVYNRILTETEILQNYNAQKSRFGL